ncbi:hypothetical protein DL770_001233 [Monosporascus sp. CRB-9-2]|nr:hypothetical protein DL770_001233 [Monosporascus sp. CRB-9-2]
MLPLRSLSLSIASLNPAAMAQLLFYTSSMATTCVPANEPTSTRQPVLVTIAPGSPGEVCYQMPSCETCNCKACTLASTYTATFSVFCPTGLMPQAYTITETFVGMSSLPNFAAPTSVPYGFTTAVETCNFCDGGVGGKPVIATVTYPSGGVPYVNGFGPTSTPTVGAESAPSGLEGSTPQNIPVSSGSDSEDSDSGGMMPGSNMPAPVDSSSGSNTPPSSDSSGQGGMQQDMGSDMGGDAPSAMPTMYGGNGSVVVTAGAVADQPRIVSGVVGLLLVAGVLAAA